jgi:hypothetical protein
MHRVARSLFSALFLVAITAVSGCADREVPTGARTDAAAVSTFNQTGSAPDLAMVASFKNRRSLTIAWAKKWIGPEGGRLDFAGFAIDVPAGAVDRVTMFTINLPVDPKGAERVVAEFGPHNQQFAVPVTIELPYQGTTAEGMVNPTIGWWNDGWVNMGGSLTSDGQRLKTKTSHFSTYAEMETTSTVDRGGHTPTVSGG